jgi:hypothetical protein
MWQIQLTAYECMGHWSGAVMYWEPGEDGSQEATVCARIWTPIGESPFALDQVLDVLEHAHVAVTDRTQPRQL